MGKLFDIKPASELSSFQMKRDGKKAEMVIYGAIGESIWEDSISAKMISSEIAALPENLETLEIRLNSPGGSVFDGVTIFERLKAVKAKKIVYVDGLAASIASVIALAGDEVIIGEASMFMIHKPMAGVYGNAMNLEEMINILDKIENQMIGIYQRNTEMSRAEIERFLLKDSWFTAEEAVTYGFADRIADNNENIAAVAMMLDKADWIAQKPHLKPVKDLRAKLNQFSNEVGSFIARK